MNDVYSKKEKKKKKRNIILSLFSSLSLDWLPSPKKKKKSPDLIYLKIFYLIKDFPC